MSEIVDKISELMDRINEATERTLRTEGKQAPKVYRQAKTP